MNGDPSSDTQTKSEPSDPLPPPAEPSKAASAPLPKPASKPAADKEMEEEVSTRRRWGRRLFIILLILFFFIFLVAVREVLSPFFLAIIIAYILEPIVRRMTAWKVAGRSLPRWVAVILLYLSGIGVITGFALLVMPQFTNEFMKLGEEVPVLFDQAAREWIPELDEEVSSVLKDLTSRFDPPASEKPEPSAETEGTSAVEPGSPQPETPPAGTPDDSALPKPPTNGDETAPPPEEKEEGAAGTTEKGEAETKRDTAPSPGPVLSEEITRALTGLTMQVEPVGEKRYQVYFTPRSKKGEEEVHGEFALANALRQMAERLLSTSQEWFGSLWELGRKVIAGVISSLMFILLTFMVSAFLLVDVPRILNGVRQIVPPRYRDEFNGVLKGIDEGLGGVVRGQFIICAVNGFLTGVGLFVLGVKYPIILALIATIFSLIPIFGTILSSVPAVGIALTQSFGLAVATLIWIIVIHLIEANLLNPRIMGRASRIHPVFIVLALVAGEHFYGLFGALLAVPVFSIFQSLFIFYRERAWPK